MRLTRNLALLLLALWFALPARADSAPATLIRNVNLLTMEEGGAVLPAAQVLVKDGVIAEIRSGSERSAAHADVTIDGGGGWLVPGLVDAHVHYSRDRELTSYLRHGVTSVISLGRPLAAMEGLARVQDDIRAGRFAGTTVYATGPTISNHVRFDDPEAARAFVREQHARGYGFVKIYNDTSRPIFDAVVAEADRLGMGVFGHMPRGMPPAYSIANGLDVLAHMEELFFTTLGGPPDSALAGLTPDWKPDMSGVESLLDQMRDHDVVIVPNLVASYGFFRLWADPESVFDSPEMARLHPDDASDWRRGHFATRPQIEKRMLRERLKLPLLYDLTWRAARKGVLLVAGTDAPIPPMFPGASLHQELRLLVAAGLTPEEALAAATRNAGELIRRHVDRSACIGVIRNGCEADLLLLSADPREDIRNSEKIVGVMSDGRWYRPDDLEERQGRNGAAADPDPSG